MENFLINKTILNSLDFSPIKQKSRLDITDTNALNLFPGKICLFKKKKFFGFNNLLDQT